MGACDGITNRVVSLLIPLLCLLAVWPSTADALGRRPPEATPASGVPARPDSGSCERALDALDAQIQELLKDEVWRRPAPMTGFIFKTLGTEPFGVCSEFFNFLVVEGLYPFKLEAFVEECTSRLRGNMHSARYDECPNAAALEQRARDSCRNGMRERVQLLNRDTEGVMAAYRKCHEFGWGHLRPIPEGPGLDVLPGPGDAELSPGTATFSQFGSEISKTPGEEPRVITVPIPTIPGGTILPEPPPVDTPVDAGPKKYTPDEIKEYFDGTVPPELPPPDAGSRQPAGPVASCCESCPSNKQERYYVPIAPDTDCQPGDVKRDDLSVEAGTCANPLFESGEDLGPWTFGPACCNKQTAQMLYNSVPSADGVTSQVGSVLRGGGCPDDPCKLDPATPDGKRPKEVEVSILSTAPGPNGRNWVPERPTLMVDGKRLKPCAQSKFYVTKEATGSGREAATAVFSAISAEYAYEAAHAADSPGTACPSHGGGTRSRAQEARDKATAAAGLALLASQAKGQITGLRATFNVTGKEGQLKDAKLDADIVNEVTQKKVRMNMPVRFESGNPSQ